ncbi:MAG: hypothetical protein CSA70_07995 [Rhodobacterales bacterium]|nr:MAG: hypothetical protein CSA70_07995 [Rhodobacterales bacterium]
MSFVGLLSACGDPLAQIPRLDEVELSEESTVVEAVAAPAELNEDQGFLSRILRKREVAPKLAETPPAPPSTEGQAEGEDVASAATAPANNTATLPAIQPETVPAPAPDPAKANPGKRRWPFGKRAAAKRDKGATPANSGTPSDTASNVPPASDLAVDPNKLPKEQVTLASLPKTDDGTTLRDTERQARKGLFSNRKAARLTGPDAASVDPGTVLPFGQIARACGTPKRDLGKEVARYPDKGGRYRLHDSQPGHTGQHTFYVTGFKDGCPRQVTGALVMFGRASIHETLRYGLPSAAKPYSKTDLAYEKIKRRVCKSGNRKPCGKSISKLEKGTVFLTVYDRFTGAQGWKNILLSDGKVIAVDRQGG